MKKIFVIAEIGINHNGDMNICKKLIDLAKSADCDAVKFQKRDIDLVYTSEYLNEKRESPWGTTQKHQKDGLEFSLDEYQLISEYCDEKKIKWFASPWDLNSINFLKNFNLEFNKIASPMIVYKKLLENIANEGKHTFISTGMSNYEMIDEAVEIFEKNKCSFELMHCVSTYPMKPEDANLNMILNLKKRYNCNVGYSGHESGLAISCAAAGLGITSLERHITLDRSMYGSDQSASLEPSGLNQLVGAIRKIEISMGDGQKKFLDDEKKNALKLRQHIKN